MSGVWVVVEEQKNHIGRISWEALAAGQVLAQLEGLPLHAIVPGAQTLALADEASTKALASVVRLEHALLSPYTSDSFLVALEQFLRTVQPDYAVFPHTYQVRDYAPVLAARFGKAFISDVTGIDVGPVFHRQLMQGRINGTYRVTAGAPCFLSVQSGSFRPDLVASGTAPVELYTPTLEASQIRTKPSDPFRAAAQGVDLTAAPLIVSVGRGIREADNLPLIQELATALGAEVAASRPICDNGWLPIERQVGSSGQTVAPKLYLAVGISGAIQHLVGMKASQCIVAINKDPDAPIFEVAHYGIVGDLFEVVPALTAALKSAKE
ncbi:MAG: electron transfer flavoprotein subunit alpha/FixB family protein [Terracidiphilus sp.]|nr:electron transfer flavoprotein subunit alpha/FixB family protein [Terracidiphilus sp.]